VFTARYGLIPYIIYIIYIPCIKQIAFSLLKVKNSAICPQSVSVFFFCGFRTKRLPWFCTAPIN